MKTERISFGHIQRFEQVPCGEDKKGKKGADQKFMLALKLGNTFKSKCKIVFHTTLGKKTVCGTIWNVTDERVELNGGTAVLLSSIEELRLI